MSVVRVYRKAAIERRLLHLDYSCWLEDQEVLTDFQITVSPYTAEAPVVASAGFPDTEHKELVFYASGGIANTNYVMRMVVRTSAGQVKQDDIGLRVTP